MRKEDMHACKIREPRDAKKIDVGRIRLLLRDEQHCIFIDRLHTTCLTISKSSFYFVLNIGVRNVIDAAHTYTRVNEVEPFLVE